MNRQRTALLAVAAFSAIGIGAWVQWRPNGAAQPKKNQGAPVVPVRTAEAALRDIALTLDISGRTEAVETVSLKARVEGQVLTVAFNEGQSVRRGDVLLQLDPADFAARSRQAEANLARDEAQLAKLRADVARYLSLKAKGFVSEEKVAELRTAAAAAEAVVSADRAAADLARLQLGYTTVRAPIDGIVGARLVHPGTAVKANETVLAVVNRVRPLNASFAVPEKYLARLQGASAARRVQITLPGGTPLEGELRFIDNAVDPSTGTIQMKAQLANEDMRLRPGQFVAIGLTLETLKQAVTVPAEAVQQGPDGAFLFVVADGSAQTRKVRVTAVQKPWAAIAEGLAAGEVVVTDGQLRLTPGAKVKSAR